MTALMGPQQIGKENTLRAADTWIFGHTHEYFDQMFGMTRVVSNSKAYGPWLPKQRAWDNPNFDPSFVIEI
ncbi:hypothetical protein BjapCC829_19090 [Bradyrhizobium barranii]|uniref:Calcineurin-like phosphoesterase domain-containing protein n=1 Tax=Bradyrhizobium barranii TaxID=2992140 RepID=A0ABY3QWV2_9BRAD|nr:hypothetical protein [Bradyrhizobium japonicum]UFW90520.1 hypothetical protein BjapCC829_19090 [Bradyrhizobium japonicum]